VFLETTVYLPVETTQIILPDDYTEFPHNTIWVVLQGQDGPVEVPLPLDIPSHWNGKYETRVDANVAYFDYISTNSPNQKIFSIAALTESQWQEIQDEPHGEALFAYNGIVYVYNAEIYFS